MSWQSNNSPTREPTLSEQPTEEPEQMWWAKNDRKY